LAAADLVTLLLLYVTHILSFLLNQQGKGKGKRKKKMAGAKRTANFSHFRWVNKRVMHCDAVMHLANRWHAAPPCAVGVMPRSWDPNAMHLLVCTHRNKHYNAEPKQRSKAPQQQQGGEQGQEDS
jgi:hypothetical protein